MAKKQKKQQTKASQKATTSKKYLLFFVALIVILFFTVLQIQNRQTYQQQAQTAVCGAPGDMGNEQGVGKFCTQGGGQCQGLQASICSADIQLNGQGLCSKSCTTDADCGTAAICHQDTLGKGCEPVACENTPTPVAATAVPTSGVPSSGCLGASCITPTVSQTPATSTQPSQAPASPTPAPAGNGGNILQLLIQFLVQLIQFFLNLFK